MSQLTCEELVDERLLSRLEEQPEDMDDEDLYSEVLSASVTKMKRVDILLSWGGPSDGFQVELILQDGEWEIYEVYYYYKDWFDGARRQLNAEQRELFMNKYAGLVEVYAHE